MFVNRPSGEYLGNQYKGINLNNAKNRVEIDLDMGGVGDPDAWRYTYSGWEYAPRYKGIKYYDQIPEEFKYNFESIRMEKDPNPDNWEQDNLDGQWKYYPFGNLKVQARREHQALLEEERKKKEKELKKQREKSEEKERLDECEDEISKPEYCLQRQSSNIPGILTPKMPNLEGLPQNEYTVYLKNRIIRSYEKLKSEYPTRPMGDRMRNLNWPELNKFNNLLFELDYYRKTLRNDEMGVMN